MSGGKLIYVGFLHKLKMGVNMGVKIFFSKSAITKVQAAVIAIIIIVALIAGVVYYITLPAPGPTTIKVGAIYPLSGSLAKPGTDAKTCIEIVVEEANAKGGIKSMGGKQIELVWADSRGQPAVAASEAERLISEEGVCMLIGCYDSSSTSTASEVAEKHGVPFLNPESTSFRLVERGFEWFFRITPDDAFFSIAFFDLLDELKTNYTDVSLNKVAIVYENTLWGADCGEVQRKYALDRGYKSVTDIAYPHDTLDLHSECSTLIAANPDVLLITSYLTDAILWTKTMKEMNFNTKIILSMDVGFVDPGYFTAVGKDADYVINRELFSPDLVDKKPAIKEADEKFFNRTGEHLSGTPGRAYTAALLMVDVLERAGSTKPEAIRAALRGTDWGPEKIPLTWDGIKFDERGQNIRAKGILVQTFDAKPWTVWPAQWATKDLVFPMPTWAERP